MNTAQQWEKVCVIPFSLFNRRRGSRRHRRRRVVDQMFISFLKN